MTIAYYNGGVRVVDISNLVGIALGDTTATGAGMREVGFYRTGNANSWSAKTPSISRNGDFFLYGNDINRGLDIYKFTASGKKSLSAGRWMTPAQALAYSKTLPDVDLTKTALFCLLPPS